MSHRSCWDTCNIGEVRSSGSLSSGHFLPTFRVYLSGRAILPTFRENPIVPNETMGPIRCPETSVRNYHNSCVITQNSAILSYFVAEVWNHASVITQNSAILSYFAADAWNHASVIAQNRAILSYFVAEAWNHASVIPLHFVFFLFVFYFVFLFWFSIQ